MQDGPEGQRGILKPYVANIAINLWGQDLLQQWNTQINIPPNTEVSHRLAKGSERNIKRYYEKQSQTIQVIQKQDKAAANVTKMPTALPLKWLTEKPIWIPKWPLTKEKLQTLEQLSI